MILEEDTQDLRRVATDNVLTVRPVEHVKRADVLQVLREGVVHRYRQSPCEKRLVTVSCNESYQILPNGAAG